MSRAGLANPFPQTLFIITTPNGRGLQNPIKTPGPRDPALVIPRGNLVCLKFIDLLKSQISNYKYQTIFNDRNSKIQTRSRPERFWLLNIGI